MRSLPTSLDGLPRFQGKRIRNKPVKRICEVCGEEFGATEHNVRVGWGRTCSKSCASKFINHYRYNTPEALLRRFWSKVTKGDGCWEWHGARFKQGYGILTIGGKSLLAHRVSVELSTGKPIPEGMLVCHHCDNPPCVRPDHLFVGTDGDNVRDCVQKGRNRNQSMTRGRQ